MWKALTLAFALLGGVVFAQQLYVGPTSDADPKWADRSMFDGSMVFCRGFYTSDRHEANGTGWWTDYPGADNNFLARLSELTTVQVAFDLPRREPVYAVVALDSPLLFRCPVLFLSDVGTLALTDLEVVNLRRYLDAGGFIWADDFWGTAAWVQWEEQLRRVLPGYRYTMEDITASHPIMSMLYQVEAIPQQPNAGMWMDWRATSERNYDSADVHFRGVADDRGRLIVVATHNTDIADGWEEEKPETRAYVEQFAASSYAIGVNIYLYALTH